MYARIGRFPEDDSDAKREVEIVVHAYDTWNVDHTIALIALPLLKQLKETKNGIPCIDYEDMPEHLQYIPKQYSTNYELFPEDDMWEPEFELQKQVWDWILDEMIWAMEQMNDDDIDPDVFYSKEFNDRMSNAFKLFGKYFRSLWD